MILYFGYDKLIYIIHTYNLPFNEFNQNDIKICENQKHYKCFYIKIGLTETIDKPNKFSWLKYGIELKINKDNPTKIWNRIKPPDKFSNNSFLYANYYTPPKNRNTFTKIKDTVDLIRTRENDPIKIKIGLKNDEKF